MQQAQFLTEETCWILHGLNPSKLAAEVKKVATVNITEFQQLKIIQISQPKQSTTTTNK